MCVQHGPHLKVAHLEAEAALHPSRVRPGLQHGPIVAGHPGPPLELGRVRRRLLEAAEIEPAEVGRRGGGGERGGPRSSHWRGSLLLGGGFPGPPDLSGLVVGLLDLHGVRPAALRSGQRHQGVVDVTGRRVLPLGTGLEGVPAPLPLLASAPLLPLLLLLLLLLVAPSASALAPGGPVGELLPDLPVPPQPAKATGAVLPVAPMVTGRAAAAGPGPGRGGGRPQAVVRPGRLDQGVDGDGEAGILRRGGRGLGLDVGLGRRRRVLGTDVGVLLCHLGAAEGFGRWSLVAGRWSVSARSLWVRRRALATGIAEGGGRSGFDVSTPGLDHSRRQAECIQFYLVRIRPSLYVREYAIAAYTRVVYSYSRVICILCILL